MNLATTDLSDAHPEAQVCDPVFLAWGGRTAFSGTIATLKVFEDNTMVRDAWSSREEGRVLVVDGGGSLRCALFGGNLAVLRGSKRLGRCGGERGGPRRRRVDAEPIGARAGRAPAAQREGHALRARPGSRWYSPGRCSARASGCCRPRRRPDPADGSCELDGMGAGAPQAAGRSWVAAPGMGPGGRATGVGGPSDSISVRVSAWMSMPVRSWAAGLDVHTGEVLAARLERRRTRTSSAGCGRYPGRSRRPMRPGRPVSGWPGPWKRQGSSVWWPHPRGCSPPSGERVKTDAKDALHLAQLLAVGQVTAVTVPDEETEAARDLVRARDDGAWELMSARHRVTHLLLRQGIVYSGGTPWTGVHENWLRQQELRPAGTADAPTTRRWRRWPPPRTAATAWMRRSLELAAGSGFTPVTDRLACLRGISTLTGFGLAVEIGDWSRLSPATIGAYLGLVPGEHSTGESRSRRRGDQDRQQSRAPAADRGGLAPSPAVSALDKGCGAAGSVRRRRWPRTRRRGQPASAHPLARLRCPPQAASRGQHRDRPRIGRLVLGAGASWTPKATEPGRSSPAGDVLRRAEPASTSFMLAALRVLHVDPGHPHRAPLLREDLIPRHDTSVDDHWASDGSVRSESASGTMSSPPQAGHARSLDPRSRSRRTTRPAATKSAHIESDHASTSTRSSPARSSTAQRQPLE